ncbi:hypothetical protein DID75_05070, partial [Candidatus Marinamargulisbacteria bacterium SCGC AG-410-N11]
MYGNAKKKFITVKSSGKLFDIMTDHFPKLNILNIIQSGGVWIKKHRVLNPGFFLEKDETITFYVSPNQGKFYRISAELIHYECKEFLVVYKPPGISTVSDRSTLFWNLTHGVDSYLSKQHYQTQPIMRLDLMVQGLVIYPKSKSIEKKLFELSQQRKIGKCYKAILEYNIAYSDYCRIKDCIGFKSKACLDKHGKNAHSLFIQNSIQFDYLIYSVILFT